MRDTQGVPEWYAGRTIFVTGGTGFMGKVLIEKLLRCCPDLDKIYILVRAKRGLAPSARLEQMFKLQLFEKLLAERASNVSKLVAVEGDVTEEGLGLSEIDRSRLEREVSVVFHGAASLKLESTLKPALEHNTRATLRVLELATHMQKLDAFIHFSTAFCHGELKELEDKIYPIPFDPREVLKATLWMDEETLNMITPRILGHHPNCYTYSKRLAESLVDSYKDQLPLAIVRPSIVCPTLYEPIPGWVDSLNGPVGVCVAVAKGVLRSILFEPAHVAEVVPVDLAVNAIIPVAWRLHNTRVKGEVQVYNLSVGDKLHVSWGEIIDYGQKIIYEYPFEAGLWYPKGTPTTNVYVYTLSVFFLQTIPAYLIDFLMILLWQKRFMVHVQNRISTGMEVLKYFTTRSWLFRLDNVLKLSDSLSEKDKEIFYLAETKYDIRDYLVKSLLGARQYCLKEPLSSLPKAKKQMKMLYVLDIVTKIGFTCLLLWFFIPYIPYLKLSLDTIMNLFVSVK